MRVSESGKSLNDWLVIAMASGSALSLSYLGLEVKHISTPESLPPHGPAKGMVCFLKLVE